VSARLEHFVPCAYFIVSARIYQHLRIAFYTSAPEDIFSTDVKHFFFAELQRRSPSELNAAGRAPVGPSCQRLQAIPN
jgi:hypothetical protein